MRRPLIAANWKMHMTLDAAAELTEGVVAGCGDIRDADIVIAPPFTALAKVRKAVRETSIGLGAQNLYWEEKGAFTGEVSPVMLKDAGCDYVVVAHSERRQLFGETDKRANRSTNRVIVKVYRKLRGKAKGHVIEALPGLGRAIEPFLSQGSA